MLEDLLRFYDVCGDNIQAYMKQRDHRIGRENKMIKGFAGTAIELEDFDPAALDLKALLDLRSQMKRKTLTVDTILDDIDYSHLTNVAVGQFLQALITFVPALSHYQKNVDEFYSQHVQKHPINPTRKTNVIPLATNSADEMTPQGMKEAVMDFLSTQMGLNEETLKGRPLGFSGDGKTFEMLHAVRKFLSMHNGDFESLRFLIPVLELWHTKWTDLSRVIRASYGKDFPHDPSTLNRLAAAARCPTPSDLRKVPFYEGMHLLDLALDAYMLVSWE